MRGCAAILFILFELISIRPYYTIGNLYWDIEYSNFWGQRFFTREKNLKIVIGNLSYNEERFDPQTHTAYLATSRLIWN